MINITAAAVGRRATGVTRWTINRTSFPSELSPPAGERTNSALESGPSAQSINALGPVRALARPTGGVLPWRLSHNDNKLDPGLVAHAPKPTNLRLSVNRR